MKNHPLHIDISENHPAYLWAKKQSDSVNAFGHIGTHLDCYTAQPQCSSYKVDVVVFECREGMPTVADFGKFDLKEKAVVLYTGVLDRCGYGTDEYGQQNTFLTSDTLDALLAATPSFVLIDACGIGGHGSEHQEFDMRCEKHGCFVIENILLTAESVKYLSSVKIDIDLSTPSTGKRCQVWGQTE